MKKFLILLFLSLLTAQKSYQPLEIDVRLRILDNNQFQVIVQVDNNTGLKIQELEGFIIEKGPDRTILREDRLTLIESYEPALANGLSVSRTKKYEYVYDALKSYAFQVSKIKFTGDHRIYTYHPKVGFLRID